MAVETYLAQLRVQNELTEVLAKVRPVARYGDRG